MELSGSAPWWVGVVLALLSPVLPTPGVPHATRQAAREPEALAVLHAWDRQRARAWAHGDVGALRRLYTAGSPAGRADVALLRRYRERGLRVRGMVSQVFAVQVLDAPADRLRLRVVDRLAGGVACGPRGCLTLPRDRADRHTVVLCRVGGRWRVARVS